MVSLSPRASTPSATRRPLVEEPAPVSFTHVLGALAVAVGLGVLGAHMLDLHGHQCDRCGRRWRHFGAFNLGDEASHTCSDCGQVQWWKCGTPHVMRGSQYVATPTTPVAPTVAALPAARPPMLPSMLPAPIASAAPSFAIQPRRRYW